MRPMTSSRIMVSFRASEVCRTLAEGRTSWLRHRQRHSDTLREVCRIAGGLRQAIDERTATEFRERQRWIQQTCPIEATIGIPIKQETDVQPLKLAGASRITHDVDGAAITEEMVKLRSTCNFVDAVEVHEE